MVQRLNRQIDRIVTKAYRKKYGIILVFTAASLIVLFYRFLHKSSSEILLGSLCSTQELTEDGYTSCVCFTKDPQFLSHTITLANYSNYSSNVVQCGLSIKHQGRLGNLMGEYATLYALAKSNKRFPLLTPEMHELLKMYFDLSIPVLDPNIVPNIPWIDYEIHDWMSPEYNNISGMFVKLRGYPCSWTFYHHLRDEIKREFTFKQDIINEAQNQLKDIKENRKNKNVTFVGVHVRRGDYVEQMKKYHGVVADVEYLNEAFTYFRKKYNNVVFVVCSDGLDWCRRNIDNSLGDVYFCYNGYESSPGKDMALLIQCNHSVISIGTYGYWVAYLTGGEVVYLTNYTESDSSFLKVFHYEDAYLPEWTGIPAKMITTNFSEKFCQSTLCMALFVCIVNNYLRYLF